MLLQLVYLLVHCSEQTYALFVCGDLVAYDYVFYQCVCVYVHKMCERYMLLVFIYMFYLLINFYCLLCLDHPNFIILDNSVHHQSVIHILLHIIVISVLVLIFHQIYLTSLWQDSRVANHNTENRDSQKIFFCEFQKKL